MTVIAIHDIPNALLSIEASAIPKRSLPLSNPQLSVKFFEKPTLLLDNTLYRLSGKTDLFISTNPYSLLKQA